MNYLNNFGALQDELQAGLSGLKEEYFPKYDVHTHATYLTVEAYGTYIDIWAEFKTRITGEELVDEKGDLYQQAHLRIEVLAQPWRAKSLNELTGIQELTNQVYHAVQELQTKFGSQEVYVLVISKEDQDKVAKQVSQTELTSLVQGFAKGMRVGYYKSVIHLGLPLASKAKIIPASYTIHLGSRTYTVEVDSEKNLNITRIE